MISEVLDKSTVMTPSGDDKSWNLILRERSYRLWKGIQNILGVDPSGKDLAIKIYLVTTSNFKKRMLYLIGDHDLLI